VAELNLYADPREIIARLWPEHAAHLSPPGNKMGGGKLDPEEGVVCNCGEVLGFPTVQDEADYVTEEPEQPDTSGAQTGEPDDDPDGTETLTEMRELIQGVADGTRVETNVDGEPDEYPNRPDYQDPDMLEELEASGTAGDKTQTAPWDEVPQGAWSPPEPAGEPKGVMPYRNPDVVQAEDPLNARVAIIDPTQPYTPAMVERQLLDIEARLERGIHYQRYWEEREFAAESVYTDKAARVRWDKRDVGAKDVRDAAVQVECREEWQELLLCRSMVRAMRETMHTLRSLQSGYQTVSRSVSESMRLPARSRP
jgi:hypothetical protein